jgi:hypothetical protein
MDAGGDAVHPRARPRPSISTVTFGSRSIEVDWRLPFRMEAWHVEISRSPQVGPLGYFSNLVASQDYAGAGVVTSWKANLKLAPGKYYAAPSAERPMT